MNLGSVITPDGYLQGIVRVEWITSNPTINEQYYKQVIEKLRFRVTKKCSELRNELSGSFTRSLRLMTMGSFILLILRRAICPCFSKSSRCKN